MKKNRFASGLGKCLFFFLTLSGCASTPDYSAFKKSNEIVTFSVPTSPKQIVRVGFAMNMNWEPLIQALNAHFPDKQFIDDFNVTAGNSIPFSTLNSIVEDGDYDLVVSSAANAPLLGSDISGESFLDRYLQTTLDSIAQEGKIYGIPLPVSAQGLYYNAALFKEKGWSLPNSLDEFVNLASTIEAAGIDPFASCFKYEKQTLRVLQGIMSDQLFTSSAFSTWYEKLINGEAKFSDYATPMFDVAEKLFKKGLFSTDDFTASLTTMRQDFFAGKIAFIDYSSDIFSLAESEKAPFTPSLAPYPSADGQAPSILYSSSVVLFIPKAVAGNKTRYAFDTSVLDYLSTGEGQDALLSGWSGVVSLKNYSGSNALNKAVKGFIDRGEYRASLSFVKDFAMTKTLQALINKAVLDVGNGIAVSAALATLDAAYQKALKAGVAAISYDTLSHAESDFTVLETSYFIANEIRTATSAQIALVPSGGFYCSNMGFLKKGAITSDLSLFYEKNIPSAARLATYTMSGSQVKTLLEYPVFNNTEVNQFVAAAGLKLVYAPWHSKGSRILSIAFGDGTPFTEATEYTVAAYPGVINERYLSTGAKKDTFTDLGDPQTFLKARFQLYASIAAKLSESLELNWTIA